MSRQNEDEGFVGGADSTSRAELLDARANLQRQIEELSYRPIIGTILPSGKPALLEQLKSILGGIDQKLAEMDR